MDVTAGILIREGKVFVARRAPGRHLAGYWEFPGGKIEAGETPEASLIREFEEEFGIVIAVGDWLMETTFHYPEKTVRLLAYFIHHLSGDFHPTAHDALNWITPNELLREQLAPADVPIAERLHKMV